jgi:lantibiotic modifying enzyme
VLGEEIFITEADMVLGSTHRADQQLLSSGGNFSLCHGLAGNAEVLGEDREDHNETGRGSVNREFLLKIASAGIRDYANSDNGWPCGVIGGETPSLMLGTSGIGYFYLRAYRPDLPSMLII